MQRQCSGRAGQSLRTRSNMHRAGSRPTAGFTLAEIAITLCLFGLVVGSVLMAWVVLLRAMTPAQIRLGGVDLPIAPSFAPVPSAVGLHANMARRVGEARAVYVFGGRHLSLPTDALAAQIKPLAFAALPEIQTFAVLPKDSRSFYNAYTAQLGGQDISAGAEDFSVVVIGPHESRLAVTCAIQVRREQRSVSDGVLMRNYVVSKVSLWDITEGAKSYSFADYAERVQGIFFGAVHTWYRYSEADAGTYEEGPTSVVFPDPWLYAGARGRADDIAAFSRFTYQLSVSP